MKEKFSEKKENISSSLCQKEWKDLKNFALESLQLGSCTKAKGQNSKGLNSSKQKANIKKLNPLRYSTAYMQFLPQIVLLLVIYMKYAYLLANNISCWFILLDGWFTCKFCWCKKNYDEAVLVIVVDVCATVFCWVQKLWKVLTQSHRVEARRAKRNEKNAEESVKVKIVCGNYAWADNNGDKWRRQCGVWMKKDLWIV